MATYAGRAGYERASFLRFALTTRGASWPSPRPDQAPGSTPRSVSRNLCKGSFASLTCIESAIAIQLQSGTQPRSKRHCLCGSRTSPPESRRVPAATPRGLPCELQRRAFGTWPAARLADAASRFPRSQFGFDTHAAPSSQHMSASFETSMEIPVNFQHQEV